MNPKRSPRPAPTEPIDYTILIRGYPSAGLLADHPHAELARVEENTLITGTAPQRDQLFDLLHQLVDAGFELLSASVSPLEDPSVCP